MNSLPPYTNMQSARENDSKSDEIDNQQFLAMLQKSDLEMVRVLDDLIYLLIRKGVIAITDLPPKAQVKLMNRANARQELGGLEQLLGGDDRIF